MRRKKNVLKFYITKIISLIEIQQQIIKWKLQNNSTTPPKVRAIKTDIQWTGSAADLVELIYGVLASKRINNGDADINKIVNQIATFFSFNIKDCYDTFRAIRRRTDSRTLFLDEMIGKLNDRMDDMDNGIFKKKR